MVVTAAPESAIEQVKKGPVCELPAQVAFLAAAFTTPGVPQLEAVRVEPLEDGRVTVSACCATAAIEVQCQGVADRVVLLNGRILSLLRGRHPEADLLAVRVVDDVHLSLRTFSPSCSVVMQAAESVSSFGAIPEPPAAGGAAGEPLSMDLRVLHNAVGQILKLGSLMPEAAIQQRAWGVEATLKGAEATGRVLILGRFA